LAAIVISAKQVESGLFTETDVRIVAQLALGAGARVIMTASSDEKADMSRQHLSHPIKTEDAFQVINRKKHPKVETEVERLTGGNKADFIIEIGGVKTLPSSIRCMKPGGLIALTGMLTSQQDGENPTDGKWQIWQARSIP
jgi:NADPH:quinone reductase-like Zn-dependent oxidoreductase